MEDTTTISKPFHLVFDQADLLPACRTILVDQGSHAIGRVRRREMAQFTELIVDRWELTAELPRGQSLAPLLDWAVITASESETRTPLDLVHAVRPRRSHLVVAITLDRENLDRLPLLIHQQHRSTVPEQIRCIGPGLLTLPDSNDSKTGRNSIRSSRERGGLGDALHGQIGGLSLAFVGNGRGGQELIRQAVSIGAQRLTFIDADTIQPENLNAMPMSAVMDVGRSKAEQLAASLLRNQPKLSISFLESSVLSPEANAVLRQRRFDTVFTFVDNDAARLVVSRICADTKTVHMDLGTRIERDAETGRRQQALDVRLFQPGRGCVACVPRMENLEDALYAVAAPPNCLSRGPKQEWNQQRSGSLLPVNAMAVSLAIEAWLGWLEGEITDSYWLRARWSSGQLPDIQSSLIGPHSSCRFCTSIRRPVEE